MTDIQETLTDGTDHLSTAVDLPTARAAFPGLEGKTFLDAACVSLVPMPAAQAIDRFLDMTMHCYAEDASLHHIQMDEMRCRALAEASRLLHADVDRIALVESTTHGLNIAANAIPVMEGDNVVLVGTDFLQVAIPWVMKRDRLGIELRVVEADAQGAIAAERIVSALDDRTRAVCLSSVQWCTGNRLDMATLGEVCKARGIWLVVDAIQEVGALEVDTRERYADFLIAGGHKWLNAPFGCGLMVLSDRVVDELQPSAFGYLALEEPEAGWGEYFRTPETHPVSDYRFPPVAKSFEIAGTSNYPGAIGLAESLKLVNDLGIRVSETQVHRLTELLRAELRRLGAHIVSCDEPCRRSAITVFRVFEGPDQDKALLQHILADNVYISQRYTAHTGGLRVSTHYYNNEEDIGQLVWSLRAALNA